ncbi:MAG: ThiF family adenylyltransferase [Synergistaceae bacterium]|nr:ThiF family adenylyltransferase [Synergistaceae bacterium]
MIKKNGRITHEIRFANQALNELREKLLGDPSKEYYACLLAKRQVIKDLCVLAVVEAVFPTEEQYKNQNGAYLRVDGAFAGGILQEIDGRIDVDTLIEVHTHPFSEDDAWFSGTDDNDESGFAKYLHKEEPNTSYASIVFSKTAYKARMWEIDCDEAVFFPALIKTQKTGESIPSPDDPENKDCVDEDENSIFNRSVRALGLENMRRIANGQWISVCGVGGLGSVMAEHLIHMGFTKINLIDFDKLELTNLNRVAGATYEDANNGRLKVEAVKEAIDRINPNATVKAYPLNVFDEEVEYILARSDWILIATDNHASRFRIHEIAFKYYVPLIAAGVNITVMDEIIVDMSGEVILIRIGDRVCLHCLGRVNYNEIAKEIHPDGAVRQGLVAKGYVKGKDIKEPAVKTLNTYLATMAVDTLVNQYTERRRDSVISVYEDNEFQTIYEDTVSVESRNFSCGICNIN